MGDGKVGRHAENKSRTKNKRMRGIRKPGIGDGNDSQMKYGLQIHAIKKPREKTNTPIGGRHADNGDRGREDLSVH